jgi:hypothetical protein
MVNVLEAAEPNALRYREAIFCGLFATDLLRQMTSDWLSGFKFLIVFMSELLFVALSLTSP